MRPLVYKASDTAPRKLLILIIYLFIIGIMSSGQWLGQQGNWAQTTWADPYLHFNSFMQQPAFQGHLAPYNNFMPNPQYPMFNQFSKSYGYHGIGKGQGVGMWNTGIMNGQGQGQNWSTWNSGIIPSIPTQAHVGPLQPGLRSTKAFGTGQLIGTGQSLGTGQAFGNWNMGLNQGQGQSWGMLNTGFGKGGYGKQYGQGKWGGGFGSQFTYPMGMMQGFGGGWSFMGPNPMLFPPWMGSGGFGAPGMAMGKVRE